MKEFIEKLISRLEEESKKWLDKFEREHRKGNYDYYSDGMNDAFDEAIEIVNQLAEEHNNDFNDFCEWKYHRTIEDTPMYKTSCYHEFEKRFVKKYKFCPYCGKKIKVVK